MIEEFQPLFDAVSAAFTANDFETLMALWDRDAEPFYIAEEHEPPVSSWAALQGYFDATAKINMGYTGTYRVVAAKPLGSDHAIAHFTLDWRILVAGQPEAYGGFNRGQAVFVRKAEGWRFTGYVEAPLAAITYLRKLYVRLGKDLA